MLLPVLKSITLFAIGFSVFAAAILLVAYLFFLPNMQKSRLGKIASAALLLALSGLQLYHFSFLTGNLEEPFQHRFYALLLLSAPPAFYFFSRDLLLPDTQWSGMQLLHLVPVLLGFFMPISAVVPVGFIVGAGYAVWLTRIVHGMRRHIQRFKFEMFFFGFFAIVAVLVLVLFLLSPFLNDGVFYYAYANFTGLAMVLIVAALIIFPEILDEITEVARATYAKSTLGGIDIDAKVAELDRVMSVEGLYQNEDLTLKVLADTIGLSGHQLSELINSRFNQGFSRYVRDCRIREAKRLLLGDREATILSISLATGFRSQSNFYAAFKEIEGISPGKYRETAQ